MNYQKIYMSIIEKRQKNYPIGYYEIHHIIPKSLGGTDKLENLVKLTAREHFICHLLLTKIYENDITSYYKMLKGFMMMLVCKSELQNRFISSRKYEFIREQYSIAQSLSQTGNLNSQFNTMWITNPVTEKSKKIFVNDEIPEGWIKGRSFYTEKSLLKKKQILEKEKEKQDRIIQLHDYYLIYKENTFEQFVELTGYTFSNANLVQQFKKYLPDFIPQNGKKRGIKNLQTEF